uniref:Transcription factor GTE10 n=1 Tax=Noccaea caerulescens TaxID=107243 RepID=A0A1J3CHU3_NOCCA
MMGKARKHSRGKSSGFVPDYMQAAETMIEPDEIEKAPAPKRSRYSLNGYSYDVPKEVLSLSKMSRSERKNLVRRLKMELEQVRDLRKKLACFSSDTVLLSPDSDIHSCSDGPRKPPQESFATFGGTQGKKRLPVRNDKHRTKKGPSQRSEFARSDVPRSSTVASLMKECETLLDRLWSHKKGWAFRTPVDPVLLNIPDYFTVIKHPMDLGTIRSRLRRDEYSSPLDFAADVRLTFSNSIAYNPAGNQYHIMARDVSTYFESRWKIIEKKIPVVEPPVMSLTSSASLESEIPVAPPRKKATAVNESKLKVESAKLIMTDGEKKKLSQDLEALEEEFPQNIIDLLSKQSCSDGQSGEIEIEIDIYTLSDEILFMVRKLLDDYLREKKQSQEKSEPCEMEIVHDSGFSNSPLQSSKGDLLMDEDVDIVGGNDPPVSSHPPLKIEKDAACRNNECNSSSSSSSDSGSSSSDSESCSSSGSETEAIKASNPTSTEDKKKQGVGINRKDDDINGEKIVVNDSLNELGLVEHDVGEKSTAMDGVDVLPDEETAPPERQIFPEKAYRAVLLKNRFADTIMKAREKSLAKGEKGDPEKLRIEREEFEKRLREEKLRLQAEAKAAEEARRKAVAEVAEKARREREQEREAARQALQKMEKTVEINEGRQFMEDLEMLRATGAEGDQLPTFMEEMSPKFSQDMLGSFKMEGNSNPLEQLGLYMKMDEDEDDEEDQLYSNQGEVDEQSLDRKERQTLSPHGVEGDDQLVTRNEEWVSEMAQDNGNPEDEKPINENEGEIQMENVPLSPHVEEGEDQFVSGNEEREEPVSQKAQDNEGKEPLENVAEKENGIVDKREQETEDVNKGEEEAKVVDKGEEEAEVLVDKGEAEPEVVDKGEQETVVVDMGEEETEAVDKGEEETDIVDMKERANEMEQETEVVDKKDEETEVLEKGEKETEVVEKGEQATEVVEDETD